MIGRIFTAFSYIARIPPIARTRAFLYNLPRAVRAWFLIIVFAGVCMIAISVYAVYLFLLYANETGTDAPMPGAVVSVEDVRQLVQRMHEREASFVAPEVVDPSL